MNNGEKDIIWEKQVSLSIHAVLYDLALAGALAQSRDTDFVFDEDTGMNRPVSEMKSKVEDRITFKTEGTLRLKNDVFELFYREDEKMGMENALTTLTFAKDRPQEVSLVRTGDITTVFQFDPKIGRQICQYDTGIMPIEMAMITRSVKNSIGENGGSLLLDYVMEMHGVATERNLLRLEVRIPS